MQKGPEIVQQFMCMGSERNPVGRIKSEAHKVWMSYKMHHLFLNNIFFHETEYQIRRFAWRILLRMSRYSQKISRILQRRITAIFQSVETNKKYSSRQINVQQQHCIATALRIFKKESNF